MYAITRRVSSKGSKDSRKTFLFCAPVTLQPQHLSLSRIISHLSCAVLIFYVNSSHSYFFLQPLGYFVLTNLTVLFLFVANPLEKIGLQNTAMILMRQFFAQFFRHSFITCGFLAREGVSWYTMIEDIVYAEILIFTWNSSTCSGDQYNTLLHIIAT